MTTAEVLRATKALIDTPEKWRKCGAVGGGRHCITDAIGSITQGVGFIPALDAIRDAVGFKGPVFQWNDAPDTTHGDVMAGLDLAIAAREAA